MGKTVDEPLMPYTNLRRFLESEQGAVSFERYMHEALYGQDGYYRKNISTVGRGGDFSTTATLGPKLGEAIGRWLQRSWEEDGFCPHVIEIGPGSGELLKTVRSNLTWLQKRRVKWHLVETSPVLQARQKELLPRRRCQWQTNMGAALEACGGEAYIFSNELPDAFPVQLLEKNEAQWKEVWLELSAAGGLVETLRPWRPEPAILAAHRSVGDFPEGQRLEFPAAWAGWLSRWKPLWRKGRMLTIDYGGPLADVYHRRPGGSLRAYLKHERRTGLDIYQNMGKQDLTSDVCFEDLQIWGAEQGLETVRQESQASFLKRYVTRWTGERNEEFLLDESGAGAAFQVLDQRVR
jgi:SAM-dependent MidA family methyltransferase